MKDLMHEKIPAVKLTWDLAVWIFGGIAIAFGWFVRWYMMDVKSDIQELKTTIKEHDKKHCKDLNHAHERIDEILHSGGKCPHCGK